jgi:hypothetical protein
MEAVGAMPLLFSYGTFLQDAVQLSAFGRLLDGDADELVGFEKTALCVDDPEFVVTCAEAYHSIVRFTGRSESRVSGVVFEISDSELASADAHEPAGFRRIFTTLASGKQAWVYAGLP